MAACENPRNILDNPLPEIPTFLRPLSPSWNQINAAMKPLQKSSFAEIFGELLFKEQHQPESLSSSAFSSSAASSCSDSSASSSAASSPDATDTEADIEHKSLGSSESSDVDPEEMMTIGDLGGMEERAAAAGVVCRRRLYAERRCSEWKRSKMIRAAFPPPISCIGRSGKPWVLFKSYREDGRFILKEIRIPTQEFMHACRKDGRLKLHIIQSDDEIPDDEDEYDEDDEDDNTEIDDDTTEVGDDDDDAESIKEL